MKAVGVRAAGIGAGLAGSACARLRADAGVDVRLFDKSCSVGGRLSTHRAAWVDSHGAEHRAPFDHGTRGFSAPAPEFFHFVEQADRGGLVVEVGSQAAVAVCRCV